MTADDIARSMRDQAARLHDEAEQWERFALLLDGQGSTRGAAPELAPYGYKRDGTPYKRKPRSAAANAKMIETRRANVRAKRRERLALDELDAHRAQLHVLSSTHPTPAELEDRELVHTTAAPAA